MLREVEAASQILGLRWQEVGVRTPDELAGASEAILGAQSNGIFVIEDSMLVSHVPRVVASVARTGSPRCMHSGDSPMPAV